MGDALTIERRGWDREAERALAPCLPDDTGTIPQRIAAGDIDLFRVNGGQLWAAFERDGDRLIWHALAGHDAAPLIEAVIDAAARDGIAVIDAPTHRTGLGRWVRRWGFHYHRDENGLRVFRRVIQ